METIKNTTQLENLNLSEDVQEQLENFGLKPEQITGDVLDIGAGEGEFAKNFKNKDGVKIVSIDKFVEEDENSEVIVCDVRELPFDDEAFDLVLSHASIPNVFINMYSEEFSEVSKREMKKALDKTFNQIIRVLKPGGEIRLSPIRIAENYESEKTMKVLIVDLIKDLQDQGLNVSLQYLKTTQNPKNNEKSDSYRMIIKK